MGAVEELPPITWLLVSRDTRSRTRKFSELEQGSDERWLGFGSKRLSRPSRSFILPARDRGTSGVDV